MNIGRQLTNTASIENSSDSDRARDLGAEDDLYSSDVGAACVATLETNLAGNRPAIGIGPETQFSHPSSLYVT